jgi:hypothetical protein
MIAVKGLGQRGAVRGGNRGRQLRLLQHILIAVCALAAGVVGAEAQEHIGSTALAHNDVTRDLAGASAPLVTGDSVFRNETVRTGADSTAKLVFLDSTNLGVGPVSSVKLDQFVYVGESNGQKMTVNLAKGVFRFTTGALDKKAYEITTPTAAIGVRGTVLDIAVQGPDTRVTLVEGQALVCPRRAGVSFAQQERNCAKAAGGVGGPRCDCVDLKNVGQTAQVKKTGSASLTSNAVNYAFNDGGFASGVLCGR